MIARRLRDKKVHGEPITFESFVIDTIIIIFITKSLWIIKFRQLSRTKTSGPTIT